MRNWGIGLLICGVLAIFGYFVESEESSKEGLGASVVLIVGGSFLANKGQKYLNLMREVAEEALNQIREKQYIDALSLSKKFRISEIEIRQMIIKSQSKSFIPFGVEIK